MGFFKSKEQKIKEQMDKDVDRLMSVCMYRDTFGVRVDILAALPAFYVRNAENLKNIKVGRYCIIDTIIFSSYVSYSYTLHGESYYFDDEVETKIQESIITNLSIIISTYYSINGDIALEIIKNRFAHFDYVVDTFGGNPGEDLDAISEAFSYLITHTIHEGKYVPFYPDTPLYIDNIFSVAIREAEIQSLVQGLLAYAGKLFTENRRKLDIYKH